MSAYSWLVCPGLTLFRFQLKIMCNFLHHRSAEPTTLSEVSGLPDKINDMSSLVPFAIQVCLESTAYDDRHWSLTSAWLARQLQKLPCDFATVSEVITDTMEAVFSHPLMEEIREGNKAMMDGTTGGRYVVLSGDFFL